LPIHTQFVTHNGKHYIGTIDIRSGNACSNCISVANYFSNIGNGGSFHAKSVTDEHWNSI
jgi:hypothetical protein